MNRIYPTDQALNPLPKIGATSSGKIDSIAQHGVMVALDLPHSDYCGTTHHVCLHGNHRPANPQIGADITVCIIDHGVSGVFAKSE